MVQREHRFPLPVRNMAYNQIVGYCEDKQQAEPAVTGHEHVSKAFRKQCVTFAKGDAVAPHGVEGP